MFCMFLFINALSDQLHNHWQCSSLSFGKVPQGVRLETVPDSGKSGSSHLDTDPALPKLLWLENNGAEPMY